MQTIGLMAKGRVSWSHDIRSKTGGFHDPRSVQRSGDRGDTGAALRRRRADHRDAGEDRVRGVPGSVQVALRADLVHRLRAEAPEGGSRSGLCRLGAELYGSPSARCGGLLECFSFSSTSQRAEERRVMAEARTYAEGVEINAPIPDEFAEILTPEAVAFVAKLSREFGGRVEEILEKRKDFQERIDAGEMPDFLPETKEIRERDWRVAPVPDDLQDRRGAST